MAREENRSHDGVGMCWDPWIMVGFPFDVVESLAGARFFEEGPEEGRACYIQRMDHGLSSLWD